MAFGTDIISGGCAFYYDPESAKDLYSVGFRDMDSFLDFDCKIKDLISTGAQWDDIKLLFKGLKS